MNRLRPMRVQSLQRGGNATIASTSNKAASAANRETSTVVLAGGAAVLTKESRTSRKIGNCARMSVK
jgi:hypothetical protein